MSQLLVYKASAGSGKTYRLAAEYVKIVIENPNSYKNILAVTFTNKATAEMKSRILDELKKLSMGLKTPMYGIISEETKVNPDLIPARASAALSNILHNYSLFSVSTIDSFVQRVIQSLLWELGIKGSLELELDNSIVLKRAADLMLDEAAGNPDLLKWLIQMGESHIDDGKPWDIRKSLTGLGSQLFTESFRLMSGDEIQKIINRSEINTFKESLKKIVDDFTFTLQNEGTSAFRLISNAGYNASNFFQGSRGVFTFFKKCSEFREFDYIPNYMSSYIQKVLDDSSGNQWLSGESKSDPSISTALISLVRAQLHPALVRIIEHITTKKQEFYTARLILHNLNSLAILGDLWLTIHKLSDEEGFMLLSDFAPLLREFVKDTDTPFLYEKMGNRYKNVMIDEFQDTSVIQWQNFKPLINNSLSQNGFSMLVGDIKQAIYRWRNGDWRILSTNIHDDFNSFGILSKDLSTNRRSLPAVIDFNNNFFTQASSILKESINDLADDSHNEAIAKANSQFEVAYSNVIQEPTRIQKESGYAEVTILPKSKEYPYDSCLMDNLPNLVSDIQKRGYRAGDIAILVRKNDDGQKVANMFLKWKANNPEAYGLFEVVSQEGLRLVSSPAVRLCIAALKTIYDPNDLISTASYAKELKQLTLNPPAVWSELFDLDFLKSEIEKLNDLKSLSVREMLESIIKVHNLSSAPKEYPYIAELQERVFELTRKGALDLGRFLDWWSEKGENLSLSMPESRNAISIMTIHKSKGLQFPVVIIPYSGWSFNKSNSDSYLWVNSNNTVFNKLPKYPVNISDELKESEFSGFAIEEDLQVLVDNINLLYVAYTRAEDELYIFCPEPPEEMKMKSTVDLINETLTRLSFQNFRVDDFVHPMGYTCKKYSTGYKTQNVQSKGSENKFETWSLVDYQVESIQKEIKQKYESTDFFLGNDSLSAARLNYGKTMHSILSRITSAKNLDEAINALQSEGLINDQDKHEIKNHISKIVKMKPFDQWFSGDWIVKTESSILTNNGEVYRPDRVMIRENEAVVVDYKFGKELPSHANQIRKYSELLSQMGYRKVESYLWYFDAGKLERIS